MMLIRPSGLVIKGKVIFVQTSDVMDGYLP